MEKKTKKVQEARDVLGRAKAVFTEEVGAQLRLTHERLQNLELPHATKVRPDL